MSKDSAQNQCQIGMVGLGVMGCNLLLNMADHGFSVAGFDTNKDKVLELKQLADKRKIFGATDIKDFIKLLKKPRAIMFLIPAGKPVDMVIKELLPYLDVGDILIDAGNSHFTDTNERQARLAKRGIQFLGIGISGGEEGARRGPSIMPSGPKKAYVEVQAILEAVAAHVGKDPCVTYLGTGSAGHYVKMVHNGIEYGIMQLIAEIYDLMKRGLGLNDDELHTIFKQWNDAELNSYLVEITSNIFSKIDVKTGKHLLDLIVDVAEQNGTGMWTSLSSMELQMPTPLIDVAVSMRDLSVFKSERKASEALYKRPIKAIVADKHKILSQLQGALYTGMIIAYAQGMALLSTAAQKYCYQYDLEEVARIWRGGCIIRSQLLEDFRAAFRRKKDLPNLLLDQDLAEKISANQEDLRHVVAHATISGIATPALMSALSYLDSYRSFWQPSNLIQAQRDYFGSHRYERLDEKGSFHTEWDK